jgi:hypothetical protein
MDVDEVYWTPMDHSWENAWTQMKYTRLIQIIFGQCMDINEYLVTTWYKDSLR